MSGKSTLRYGHVTRRMRSWWRVGGLVWISFGGCASTGSVELPPPENAPAVTLRGQDDDDDWSDQMNPKRWVAAVKAATGYGPDRKIAESAFEQAESLFVEATSQEGSARKAGFKAAAEKYKIAAERWPDSALEEDALFMLSESYFFADRYPSASATYEVLVKKYPNTRHMDTIDQRRFALARYWVDHYEQNPDFPITPNLIAKDRPLFDKFGHGVRVLDKIRFDDPTGKLADDATMAAGLAQFKQKRFARADELFGDLRRSFPNSEHQFRAHLLGLQCKLEIYQGPQYSVQPMDEAEQLLKQIHRQFPEEAEKHREFLAKAWQDVRLNKAQYDWEMARYYHKRKEFAAARQYYGRVREDYQDTSLAEEAATELASIRDEPDKPDPALPWVTRIFPTPDREKPLVARNPLENFTR